MTYDDTPPEGTVADQTLLRINPSFGVTAVADNGSDFQTRQAAEAAPVGLGWEYVLRTDLVGNAPRWATVFAPAMKVRNFTITSVSDAV